MVEFYSFVKMIFLNKSYIRSRIRLKTYSFTNFHLLLFSHNFQIWKFSKKKYFRKWRSWNRHRKGKRYFIENSWALNRIVIEKCKIINWDKFDSSKTIWRKKRKYSQKRITVVMNNKMIASFSASRFARGNWWTRLSFWASRFARGNWLIRHSFWASRFARGNWWTRLCLSLSLRSR